MGKLFRAAVALALLLNLAFAGIAGAQSASGGGENPGVSSPTNPPYVCPPGTVPTTGTGPGGTGTTGTGGGGTTGTAGGGAGMTQPECAPVTTSTDTPPVVAGETARPPAVPAAEAPETVAGVAERQGVEAIQLPRTGGPGPLAVGELALMGLGLAAAGRWLRRR